jgi:hypothetical protein
VAAAVDKLGCETEADSEELVRCASRGAAARLERKFENIVLAASSVGSSLLAAGVPVLDLDRLVDFPKDPVSGIALRTLETEGLSVLSKSGKGSIFAPEEVLTQETA